MTQKILASIAVLWASLSANGVWAQDLVLGRELYEGRCLESLRDRFPAACGVDFMDERLYPQEPQCNGVDVPHRISGEVPTSGV